MKTIGTKVDPSRPRWRRVALVVSLVFHACVLTVLGLWYVNRTPTAGEDVTAASDLRSADVNGQRGRTDDKSVPPAREPSPDVSREQVNNTLERVTDAFEEKPVDEQLTALDDKARALEQLATKESVEEIAEKFREWTSTKSRESEPAKEPVGGEFDFDTAQIHEVQRNENEAGEVNYTSVLVDAAGRTMEVEMPTADGEQAYRTMQTLKQYPLAEKVYRSMVMPLIDKAIASREASADPPAPEDDRDPFDASP